MQSIGRRRYTERVTRTAAPLLLALTLVACGASDDAEESESVPEAPAAVAPEPVDVPADVAAAQATPEAEPGTEMADDANEQQAPPAAPAPQDMQGAVDLPAPEEPFPTGGEGEIGGLGTGRAAGGGVAGPGLGGPTPARRRAARRSPPRSPSAFDIEE